MAIIIKQSSPAGAADLSAKAMQAGWGAGPGLQVGALLRTLSASKPEGKFLELDSGAGLATIWLLDGMDINSRLVCAEQDKDKQSMAYEAIGADDRLKLDNRQPRLVLDEQSLASLDFLFCGGEQGKFANLQNALGLLKPGGLYLADGLTPQEGWDEKEVKKVSAFLDQIESRDDMSFCSLDWASGLLVAAKRA